MKTIKLTQNQEIILDDKYYEHLSQFNWSISKNRRKLYAHRNVLKSDNYQTCKVLIHRIIMELEGFNIEGKQVDHKNGNGLDNRIDNLRLANNSQNQQNISKRKTNTSGYKGVFWDKSVEKWKAQLKINTKTKHLGYFEDKILAAKAYNDGAIKYFGEFANINVI